MTLDFCKFKRTVNYMKMILKDINDIPADWEVLNVRSKNVVTIREPVGFEKFKVSWGDTLTANPDLDVIVNNGRSEYPCKTDIFNATYEHLCCGKYRKTAVTRIARIPNGVDVEIETLEGKLNSVSFPDFVAIGPKGELYANSKQFVEECLEVL